MHGPPRRKGNTDYLQFRPYHAIVAPQLSKRRGEARISMAFKISALVGGILILCVLLTVPLFTYFTSEFSNFGEFALNSLRNMTAPLTVAVAIAFLSGTVPLLRR